MQYNMNNNALNIPEDLSLTRRNLKELQRSFNVIQKPCTVTEKHPSFTIPSPVQKPSPPFRTDFDLVRRMSSPRGPGSTIDSFVTSVDPRSSLVSSTCDLKLKTASENTLTASKQVTEVPQMSVEDEGNFTVLPTFEFCPQCQANKVALVRFKMPTLSFWERLLCIGDAVNCCTSEDRWAKYGEYLQECSKCRTLLKKFQTCPI